MPQNKLKPRKAPRQTRAEHTVAAILEAAALILETHGLPGFNTNLIAERAGVSVGSLYQYFPGKEALIVALSQREHADFFSDASAGLLEPTGSRALKHLIAAAVHQQLRRPALARLLDMQEETPAIAAELAAANATMGGLLRKMLEREDIPPQEDLDACADDVFVILRALSDTAGQRANVDPAQLQRRMTRAVFGYLGMPRLET